MTVIDLDEEHLYQPRMLLLPLVEKLKFTTVGSPATHLPQGLGGLPGMTSMATARMKQAIESVGVPPVPEFLEQIVASEGHLWACRMSAEMNHRRLSDLYEEVAGIISAADFIDKTECAQLLFIRARKLDRHWPFGLPTYRGRIRWP